LATRRNLTTRRHSTPRCCRRHATK